MDKILIIGAGGHATSIIDCIVSNQLTKQIAILTDDRIGQWNGVPIIGNTKDAHVFKDEFKNAVVAVGNNKFRMSYLNYLKEIGYNLPALIHKTAYVSSNSTIEDGTVILGGAFVNGGCRIGKGCIVNTMASVDHDCVIHNGVHISPNSVLCGTVKVGEKTWIGAGSTVIDHISIGSNTVIGAGSLVLKDVLDNLLIYGSPAKAEGVPAIKI